MLTDAKVVVMLAAVSDVLAGASLLLLLVQAGATLHFLKALKKGMHYTALTFSL